jgi:hypothetical protein
MGAIFCFVASPEGFIDGEGSCQYGVVVNHFIPIFYSQDSSLPSNGVFLNILVIDNDDPYSPSFVPVYSLSPLCVMAHVTAWSQLS